MATNANFFHDLDPADQSCVLAAFLLHAPRTWVLPTARTEDRIRDAIDVLNTLDLDIDIKHITLESGHIIKFTSTPTLVYIAPRRRGDGNLSYRVDLGYYLDSARYFDTVDDAMIAFAAIVIEVSLNPASKVTWSRIEEYLDHGGSTEPIEPWATNNKEGH